MSAHLPSARSIRKLTREVLQSLPPQQQLLALEAAEREAANRAAYYARKRRRALGETRREKWAKAEKNIDRAIKIYKTLGDAAPVIRILFQAKAKADKLAEHC